ncbi:hypothetical protein PPRY_a1791 [Pseudoalteromonas prydzensis ACAM 620]|nr:hypothetical protein [Pseudoalteromonas prydzensis ACAM 620]
MTTMTSMTNRVLARVVAVTVGGHGKNKGDQGDFNLLLGFDGE